MRIWIIHQNAYAPTHSASTRHFELARQLVRRGHEVLIVASSFYHKGQQETRLERGDLWRQETIDGVRFHWLRTPPYRGNGAARLWNMLVFTWRAWRLTGLRHEPRPDVVLGSSPHLFSPWAALRLARRFGKPFVLEIRDVWPAVPIEIGAISPCHPLMIWMAWLERTYYRQAECVISILPFGNRRVQETIGRSGHVEWIPNGSPLDPVSEPTQREAPLTLMYAGAHSLYSGLDVVLDAAEMLQRDGWSDRIRIRLVGDGPEKARLVESARQRRLSIVSFEPPVAKSQVFQRLQEADAFLLVYQDAPFMRWGLCPNKLYDYLAAARPVIFGIAAPNNPVRDANAGLTVSPQDPRALAAGIQQLAQTPWPERVAMGQRGRAYVQTHHNFLTLGTRLDQVLTDAVAAHRARRSRSAGSPPPVARSPHYQPLVIVGAPRSGTNMLRDVLTSLPSVCTWPCDEINFIWRHGNAARPDDELRPDDATTRVRAFIRRAFDSLARRSKADWIVEKTCANSLRVGFVDRVLPEARYIFLIRDGRDAVASAIARWSAPLDWSYVARKARFVPPADLPRYAVSFAANRLRRLVSPQRRLATWGPRFRGLSSWLAERSLAEVCARQWQQCVAKAQTELAYIEPSRVVCVRYEDFVMDPRGELRTLLERVGIDASPAEQDLAVRRVSDGSVGKWRRALDDETLARIAPIIEAQLVEFGYSAGCGVDPAPLAA